MAILTKAFHTFDPNLLTLYWLGGVKLPISHAHIHTQPAQQQNRAYCHKSYSQRYCMQFL